MIFKNLISTPFALGVLATAALAHDGDHSHVGLGHVLGEHGYLAIAAILAVGFALFRARKI